MLLAGTQMVSRPGVEPFRKETSCSEPSLMSRSVRVWLGGQELPY